jgi:hypothetical protein
MMELFFTTRSNRQESEASSSASRAATATTIYIGSRKRQRRQPLESRRQHSRITTTLVYGLVLLCTSRIISLPQVSAYVPSPLFPSRGTNWMIHHDSNSISSSNHNKKSGSRHYAVPPQSSSISKQWKQPVDDGDRDLDMDEAGWLSWMVRGGKAPARHNKEQPPVPTPPWSRKTWTKWVSGLGKKLTRGSSDLRMREAEELGGLPRPDRYSSRYVK